MHSRGLRRAAAALPALLVLLWLGVPDAQAQGLTVIKVATYTTPQAPEGVWIDSANNKYVTLALTGEIQQISPDGVQSTVATMPLDAPPGTICSGFPAIIGNAYGDGQGNLFVGVHSCDPGDSGLWKVVIATGAMTKVASAPPDALLNGTIVDGTTVLVTDSKYDLVWQAPTDGTGQPVTVWKDDPLFKVPPGAPFPGPNGISIFHGDAYVAVSDTALIVKVPILPDGSAGQASVHARLSVGCDDFSFDVLGDIYCTSDPFETVTQISPTGAETVLFTAADGLDGPTSTYFGSGTEGKTLYITNGAFPFFPGTGNGPSLLKVALGVTGYHFPQPEN
jgi:sugar lactone lactonase YvrE